MEDIKTIEATPAKDLPACPVETTLMLIGDKSVSYTHLTLPTNSLV